MSQSEKPQPLPGAKPTSAARSDRLAEAREALLGNNPQQSLEICKAEMRPGETEAKWLLLHAETLVALDQGMDAFEDLISVLRQDPEQPEALFRIGQVLLQADEAGHAERYLQRAVSNAGGKRSYAVLLKKAHKRALIEGSSLDAPQSALPAADDDLDRDPNVVDDQERVRAALGALLSFEQESGMFESKITTAIGATKKVLPRLVDSTRQVGKSVGKSQQVRKIAILASVGLVSLVLVIAVSLLVMRSCQSSEILETAVTEIDVGLRIGGYQERNKAIHLAQRLLEQDEDNSEVALRLAWLYAARSFFDTVDPNASAQAQKLLDKHADADRPMAVLASALLAVTAGQPPGPLASREPFANPLFESMRQEILALDARHRSNPEEAQKLVNSALPARTDSIDLHAIGARAALENEDLEQAKSWLDKAQSLAEAAPSLELLRAQLHHTNAQPPAAIAEALTPAVANTAPDKIRFAGLALAVTLRSQLGDEATDEPPFSDIEKAIKEDKSKAPAAAQALLTEGWPDFAQKAMDLAEQPVPPMTALALAVAEGNLKRAAELVSQADMRATGLLWSLAPVAAAAGELRLVENCMTRLDLLKVSPCTLAATRARVAIARGEKTAQADNRLLKSCASAGPVLLWKVERAIASDGKGLKPILRKRLRYTRSSALDAIAARGLFDLSKNQPIRADEAGRILQIRSRSSRSGLILRIRAAISAGEYHRIAQLIKDAPLEIRNDPMVVGYAALAEVSRGERNRVVKMLDQAEVPESNRGLGLVRAARAMASMNRRNAKATLVTLKSSDASPYVEEAKAMAHILLQQYGDAIAALDKAGAAAERRSQHGLMRAEVAFREKKRSKYREILKKVGTTAERDLANGPMVAEAFLRLSVIVSNNFERKRLLDEANEKLLDWKRQDRRAPKIKELQRLMWRHAKKPLEFPE